MEGTVKKRRKNKVLRIVGRLLMALVVLFVLLILFVRSKWGQAIIVNKVVDYVSEKTNAKVEIEKLYITFGGNVMVNGLYLEDTKGDTLLYSKSLEANMPLLPIIKGKSIGVDNLDWEGVVLNIIRKDSIEGYNFQFLIDAFSSKDTTTVQKDTASAPLNIILGDINLNKFDVTFYDAILGIDSRFILEDLSLVMDKTDLENMDFRASELKLSNATVTYSQGASQARSSEETSTLPFLAIDELTLNNVNADYQSVTDGSSYYVDIKEFYSEIPTIDLNEPKILINQLNLSNSKVVVQTRTDPKKEMNKNTDSIKIAQPFEWPDFKINVKAINLESNALSYINNDAVIKEGVFNSDAIVLNSVSLQGKNIFLEDKVAGLNLENFNFSEASGINLKQLALFANVTENSIDINNLNLALNNNKLQGNAKLNYNSLASFIAKTENTIVSLNIPSFQVDLKDVFKFKQEFGENEILKKITKNYFFGNVRASGKLSSLEIPNLKINWGKETYLALNGQVDNAISMDKLKFDVPKFTIKTNKENLKIFVNEDSLGVNLPDLISLNGYSKGTLSDVTAKAELNSSQGKIDLKGSFKNENQLAFNADLNIEEYQLGKLLNNDNLGGIILNMNTTGKGKTINELNADILINIEKLGLKNYEIENLEIDGVFNNGKGEIKSDYKDKNLNINFLGNVVLDSLDSKANIHLDIIGADLQALGVTDRNVRAGFKLDAEFKGNSEKFNLNSVIKDGVAVYSDKTYLLGGLSLNAFVDKDTTSVTLKNKILNFELHSNASPEKFTNSLQRHVSSYFYRDIEVPDSIINPVNLELKGKINQAPLLNEVLLVNLKGLDTIDVAINYKEKLKKLTANISAPYVNYAGSEIDSLALSMTTDIDKFDFDFGFKEINSGPLSIKKTNIKGNQLNNELSLGFTSYYDKEELINIQTSISGQRDSLRLHVINDNLILNKNKWDTPTNNSILITKNQLYFNDFNFSRNGESLNITDPGLSTSNSEINISFNNFKLNKLVNFLNPGEQLISGILNGNLSIKNPFKETGIVANLELDQLNMLNVDLGTLNLDANSNEKNNYDFFIGLKEGQIDLDLKGDYLANESQPVVNMNLAINKFSMMALEGFTNGEITKTSGYFTGSFNLNGNLSNPMYSGEISFKDANFNIKQLNQGFTLDNDVLKFDNQGLSMKNFTILDERKNSFSLTGTVGTENFTNPTFNIDLNAKDFQVINSSNEDNDLVYGIAIFDVNGTLTGDLEIPKLDINLVVSPETDITYILPNTTVDLEQRDGIVTFVNRENLDAILTRTEEKTATITGFDINANLKIGNGANFKIIIDESTNDNFQVSGNGDFNFKMNPNGLLNLTGKYDITGGHYEMNLYNLVNRKFQLKSGSSVGWYGDPFDAKLDVVAIYEVETSASDLMAAQISGSDSSVQDEFREVLPFYVYLNIDGELMQPEISFNLDMPEDEQGAVSGQVYSKVQQLNEQVNELNQQVFSLLVLNRFYPQSNSDGSSGGVASIARDNLNDALSDQLNVFSDKLLGDTGVELDFGLDSYTDYQGDTPQDRTQLDIAAKKKLFNDRLIVSVGSEVDIEGSSSTNEATPIIGNVSLEYLLTDNGRYRLKGFRKNEFENVIDGQTIISGIAVIFTQEFNKFNELWQAILRGKTDKEKKESKEATKNNKESKE